MSTLIPAIHRVGQLQGKDVFYAYYDTPEIKVVFTNVGASIVSLKTKDKGGKFDDIVLGYDTYHDYANNTDNYMGSVVGRCANRIRKGKFTLNNETFQLAVNNGVNHLHGGDAPFNTKVWDALFLTDRAVFRLFSKDGEGNYPGNVEVSVTYILSKKGMRIVYEGTTDKDTILNLTNHTYFNLDGHAYGSLANHWLKIEADSFIPVDETLIPSGDIMDVSNTPFDFRKAKPLLRDVDESNEQLKRGYGYDHCFVMKGSALLFSRYSKRSVQVQTNMPGIQLYTGNYLNAKGKQGVEYGFRSGVALETQYFPDSINQPKFASCLLRPQQTYKHEAIFLFDVIE